MPRDPARIPRVLSLLRRYWERYPDLRLGQMLVAALPPHLGSDPFYFEDDALESWLRTELRGEESKEG